MRSLRQETCVKLLFGFLIFNNAIWSTYGHDAAVGDFRQAMQTLVDLVQQQQEPINGYTIPVATGLHSISEDDLAKLKLNSPSGIQRLLSTSMANLQATTDGVSERCMNATGAILHGLQDRKTWALKMVDAAGKPASSLLRDARFTWLGSFSECVEISSDVIDVMGPPFNGQYCLATIPMSPPQGTTQKVNLKIGFCMPDTCNSSEVEQIVKSGIDTIATLLPQLNVTDIHPDVRCQPNDMVLDDKAIVAIVVIGAIVFLVVMGTLYDVFLEYRHTQDENIILGLLTNEKVQSKEIPKGLCTKLLLSFSVYTNASKILSTNQSAGSLQCINGIRFISMTWVVLGHTLALAPLPLGVIGNMGDFPLYIKRWTFHAILNATVSVDTFFLLSGLLVTYLALKEMDKNKGKLNWVMFYVHRYIRLTPPYMLVMMVLTCLLTYTGSGPFWVDPNTNTCPTWWWTNILYINNLVHSGPNEMCMPWSWYLANDMQFYIITPLFLIPLYKSPIGGSIWIFIATLGSIIATWVISSVNQTGAGGMVPGTGGMVPFNVFFDLIYVHPWTRLASYTVGVYVGFLLFKTKCSEFKMHKGLVLLGWATAAFLCISTLYGLYGPFNGDQWSNELAAFYNATWRFAWSLGVGWVIFACCSGYGGFVNTLLSWNAMIPLSRMTYCTYLIHPVLMMWFYQSQESLIMLTTNNLIYYFFGHLVGGYSLAFVASLLFEAPILGVEKALLGKFR